MTALIVAFLAILLLTFWATRTWCLVRVFNLIFATSSILAIIAFWRETAAIGKGMWYSVAFMLCLLIPAIFSKFFTIRKPSLPLADHGIYCNRLVFNKRILWGILLLSVGLGLVYPIVRLQEAGFSFSSLFYTNLTTISKSVYSQSLLGQNPSVGWHSAPFLSFLYLAPLVGGLLAVSSRYKWAAVILAILPTIFALVVTSSKSFVILSGFLVCSSAASAYFLAGGRVHLTLALCAKTLLLAVGALLFFLLGFQLRYSGSSTRGSLNWQSRTILIYSLGGYMGFDAWYSAQSNLNNFNLSGMATFTAIPHLLGYPRNSGVYSDYTPLEAGALRHVHTRTYWRCTYDDDIYLGRRLRETNIYTSLRGLICDFGTWGSLLFALCAASLSAYLFAPRRNILRKRRLSVFHILLATSGYLFVLYSFIISPFIYTTILVALLLFLGILFLSLRRAALLTP